MNFSEMHFGVDGDSITAWRQWSYRVYQELGFASHTNVAVGSSVWYKRTIETAKGSVTTQEYTNPDFAGISDGWEETDDLAELQKRVNNCAYVHIQKYIDMVHKGEAPVPDVFAFAFGTNDALECIGDASAALTGKTLEDNEAIDLFTEAGAARWCIQRIYEEFPACRIFVLTPIQTADPVHNAKNEKVCENLKQIAGGMSVQLVDCFHNCGICEKFEVIGGQGKYLRDGLHPDEPGQQLEGRYAAMVMRNHMF